jgi:asparagine synthase (glutamine-hydrolysing)
MYFARVGTRVIFGNTLEVVRKYPGIGGELNEEAIGDYLLFGHSMDLGNTFFSQVHSLPPARRMVWNDGIETASQRYWSLPEPDRYHSIRTPAEYAFEFRKVFGAAVRDRMRAAHAGIALSGGLDSGAVAAVAASSRREGLARTELHAYCSGHDWMVPETERHYASLTAGATGIPTTYISIEQSVFDGKSLWRTAPEPRLNAVRRNSYNEIYRQMTAAGQRALFTGLGGDGVFGPALLDWRKFLQSGSIAASARALVAYCAELRVLPLRKIGATMLRRPVRRESEVTDFSWLAPDFVRRADLPGRVRMISRLRSEWTTEQHRIAYDPFWTAALSLGDPEFSRIPAKCLQPFFDLRVVQFAVHIPPLPWLIDKLLLREATRGLLPETIRRRRKIRGTGRAIRPLVKYGLYSEAENLAKHDALSHYIDQPRLLRNIATLGDLENKNRPSNGYREIELPLSVGFWLKSASS